MPSVNSAAESAAVTASQYEFDSIYQEHRNALFGFALQLTHNPGEAEDLFQETWLRVAKNQHSIDLTQNLRAWIFTIMANLNRDALRRKRTRRLFLQQRKIARESEEDISPFMQGSVNPDPARESDRNVIGREILRALDELPDRQRWVFMLKEMEGFKLTEISEILAVPVGTVKSLMYRAVKRLRKELEALNPSTIKTRTKKCGVKILSV